MKTSERASSIPARWRFLATIVSVLIALITIALDSLLNMEKVARIVWRGFGIVAVFVGLYFLYLKSRPIKPPFTQQEDVKKTE
ncbi:hypothetical protein HYR99_08610 [Candidatus Poribacteria bacterium]|nr:hypothetical protein [Candidatus Poribacteria bacterium]